MAEEGQYVGSDGPGPGPGPGPGTLDVRMDGDQIMINGKLPRKWGGSRMES